MIVIVLSAAPAGLRGALTRWLMEIDAGVYVGHLSARVRDQLWELVRENVGTGRALMAWSSSGEQHLSVATIGYDREPVDMDGMTVMLSPERGGHGGLRLPGATPAREAGWSIAGRRRRFRSSGIRPLPVGREKE